MTDYTFNVGFSLHTDCWYEVAVTRDHIVVTETLDGATAEFHLTAPATLRHDNKTVWYIQPGPATSFAGVADSYGFTIDTTGTECDPWGMYPEGGVPRGQTV